MSLLEDRIIRIMELRQQGYTDEAIAKELRIESEQVRIYEKTVKDSIQWFLESGKCTRPDIVAKSVGLSLPALTMLMDFYKLPSGKLLEERVKENTAEITISNAVPQQTSEAVIPQSITRKYSIQEFRIAQIRQALAEGAHSLEEVAAKIGLSPITIKNYAYAAEVEFPFLPPKRGYAPKEERVEQIRQAMRNGADTVEKVAAQLNLHPATVYMYSKSADLNLPVESQTSIIYRHKTRRKPEVDKFMAEGLTLKEIGSKTKLSIERIRQYIVATDQHAFWRKKRKEKKEAQPLSSEYGEKIIKRRICSVFKLHLLKRAEIEGWSQQKAMQYITSRRRTKYTYEQLYTLFKNYEAAKNHGEKLSLEELGDAAGIFFVKVGSILKQVGVEPMYGAQEKHITPTHKKEALHRAFALPMSAPDIAHFLQIPFYVAEQAFKRIGERILHRPNIFSPGKLTYSLASQIYEAQDLGFTQDEIGQLFDAPEKVVTKALEARPTLERTIVHALKVLYPEREVTHPYRDWKEE